MTDVGPAVAVPLIVVVWVLCGGALYRCGWIAGERRGAERMATPPPPPARNMRPAVCESHYPDGAHSLIGFDGHGVCTRIERI